VSRIWNALKEAEQEKSRAIARPVAEPRPAPLASNLQALLERAHSIAVAREDFVERNRSDRRKSRRREHRAPLLVYGSDPEKQPFHEETITLDVSDSGCSLALESEVMPEQRLYLINARNQALECRVVQVGKRLRGKVRVALELIKPDPSFWHAA
jgi:hypothetical protein